MTSIFTFRTVLILFHAFAFVIGSISIEFMLFVRRRIDAESHLTQATSRSIFTSVRSSSSGSIAPYILTSLRRFGTIIFGITCFSSIGFVATLCVFHSTQPANREYLESMWRFDALACSVLLFVVIPMGLSSKYINLRSNLETKQKLLRSLAFLLLWIGFGTAFGNVILSNMFAMMKNQELGFLMRSIYYMCGFGLFFVAVLVGFSGIYFPYLLYIINRDVSSVRQLENLISDCRKARKELKLKMMDNNLYFSDDEASTDDEFFNLDPASPGMSVDATAMSSKEGSAKNDHLMTTYPPAETYLNQQIDGLQHPSMGSSKIGSFFKRLKDIKVEVSSRLYKIKYAKNFTPFGGPESSRGAAGFNMWMMMNQLKNDLDYLRMLKREKESSSKLSGKIILSIKCLVACGCMINCFKICKRAVLMLSSDYGSKLTLIENQKILTKVYYEFMRDEIVSSILNDVLENVQLPTAFDFLISRANSIFLMCVMISSVSYFLDFGLILLKTKYLQKNKLMSDSSLGMALACFMILTFPSQFFLVVPFLPKELKLLLMEFLFENDIYVWFGMRYRFDVIVLSTILLTFVAVVCLHYSRSFNKMSYNVGSNV